MAVAIRILIDKGLRVFHAHTDRKSLRLHGDSLCQKHFKGISGTVTDCKTDGITGVGEGFVFCTVKDGNAVYCAVFFMNCREFCLEMHLAAAGSDFFTDILHNLGKNISSDMRLIHI